MSYSLYIWKLVECLDIRYQSIDSTAQSQQSGNRWDDFFLFNDEEETVSRNYLMIMDGRLSSSKTTVNESSGVTVQGGYSGDATSSSTFGHIPSLQDTGDSSDAEPSFFMPGDKLIIKAKVYILEILEVLDDRLSSSIIKIISSYQKTTFITLFVIKKSKHD